MTEPTQGPDDADPGRSDEDREISDVGLPRSGDGEPSQPAVDEADLDEVFPPQEDGA